jgi:zinc/manganese transport system permease protein
VTSRPSWALALSAGLAVALTWLGIGIGFYTGYPSSVCISLLAFVSYVVAVGSSQVGGWRGQLRRNLSRG